MAFGQLIDVEFTPKVDVFDSGSENGLKLLELIVFTSRKSIGKNTNNSTKKLWLFRRCGTCRTKPTSLQVAVQGLVSRAPVTSQMLTWPPRFRFWHRHNTKDRATVRAEMVSGSLGLSGLNGVSTNPGGASDDLEGVPTFALRPKWGTPHQPGATPCNRCRGTRIRT